MEAVEKSEGGDSIESGRDPRDAHNLNGISEAQSRNPNLDGVNQKCTGVRVAQLDLSEPRATRLPAVQFAQDELKWRLDTTGSCISEEPTDDFATFSW